MTYQDIIKTKIDNIFTDQVECVQNEDKLSFFNLKAPESLFEVIENNKSNVYYGKMDCLTKTLTLSVTTNVSFEFKKGISTIGELLEALDTLTTNLQEALSTSEIFEIMTGFLNCDIFVDTWGIKIGIVELYQYKGNKKVLRFYLNPFLYIECSYLIHEKGMNPIASPFTKSIVFRA
jgi:hypothetical protein